MKTGPQLGKRLVVAASLALCSALAAAAPAIVSFSGGTNFPAFNGTNQTVGWSFTVAAGNGITVTDLGWWDATPATPLAQSHQVGLWTITGTLLASTTVQTNGNLSSGFRYASITPLALTAGSSYLIGGAITSPFSDVYVSATSPLTMDPMVIFNQAARNGSSGGFSAPTTLSPGNGRFGPNFEFVPTQVVDPGEVPEPSTALLLLAGLGLVGTSLRRSKPPAA